MIKKFKIGGLYYFIDTDIEIRSLESEYFEKFKTNINKPNIVYYFRSVEAEPTQSLCLELEERKKLLTFFKFIPNVSSKFIGIPKVFNHLLSIQPYSDQVIIEARPFSLTIFDFKKNVLSTYYINEYRKVLETSFHRQFSFAHFLVNFNSALIHCSAINRNKKAAIFLAPDNGGKTTIINTKKEGIVLSDDQVLISKSGFSFFAHGTPWGTITDETSKAKISAFFILKKATDFGLSAIGSTEIINYFWSEHISNRFYLTSKLRISLFNLFVDLSRSAPAFILNFSKDFVDWDAIDQAMINR